MIDVCPFKFEELPERDGSASIDHENIRFLVTKMFKVFKGISSSNCKRDFLVQKCNVSPIKKQTDFQITAVHSVFRDTESMKFVGLKIRETLPSMLKQLENLKEYKKAIKQWEPATCPYRLCKTYIYKLRFI